MGAPSMQIHECGRGKKKIILPYLERLGLRSGDLNFETSLSLQIGTNEVSVNGRDPKLICRVSG